MKNSDVKFNLKLDNDISDTSKITNKPLNLKLKEFFRDIFDNIFRRQFYKIKFKNFFKTQVYKIDLILPSKGFSSLERKKKLNSFSDINGKDILILGCGNGDEVFEWVKFKPKSITGIDILSYKRSWNQVKLYAKKKKINTKIVFVQGDILNLKSSKKFDFIVSDAVFEHLKNFQIIIKKCRSLLVNSGIMYASYGPLWYNLGGDHFSNRNNSIEGFNHLLLSKKKYQLFFQNNVQNLEQEIKLHGSAGVFVKKKLFSKLTANQYMEIYKKNKFNSKYTVLEFCPISYELLKKNRNLGSKLLKKFNFKNLENFYLKTQIVYLKKLPD